MYRVPGSHELGSREIRAVDHEGYGSVSGRVSQGVSETESHPCSSGVDAAVHPYSRERITSRVPG